MSERSKANGSIAEPNESKPTGAQGDRGAARPTILVDASNVAYGKTSAVAEPQLDCLKRMLSLLGSFPVRVVAIADATLRHKIDYKAGLEEMFKSGEVEQVPAGTSADEFLWRLWKSYTAQGSRAYIVTNDLFPTTNARAESRGENPRIAFMFVGSELMLQPPIGSLLVDGDSAEATNRPGSTPSAEGKPEHLRTSSRPTTRIVSSDSGPESNQSQSSTPTMEHAELIDSALEVIASLTQPPGGIFRRVNFATVSNDLHHRFGGDFVASFGLSRPKDLAEELAKRDLVTITYTNTTMYVEPTLAFEGRIMGRRFPRRQLGQPITSEREPSKQTETPDAAEKVSDSRPNMPEVIEVASRELGPTVEIPELELFLKLVHDTHPPHVFHWWSQRKSDENRLWQLEGEFFFVSQGTTYRLLGRGYRKLEDFVDGRARGLRDATDRKVIGDPDDRSSSYDSPSRPQIWKAVLRARNLDEYEYRPSEGDIYYCVREGGFSDFAAFLAAERAKPKPQVYY